MVDVVNVWNDAISFLTTRNLSLIFNKKRGSKQLTRHIMTVAPIAEFRSLASQLTDTVTQSFIDKLDEKFYASDSHNAKCIECISNIGGDIGGCLEPWMIHD